MRRWGFGPEKVFEVILAEKDGDPRGSAMFFRNYSSWEGRPGLYLEDLFVPERFRKQGIGLALLKEVARIAVERGCPRVDWAVLTWDPAREFYRSIGAVELEEWRINRLTGEALAAFACWCEVRVAAPRPMIQWHSTRSGRPEAGGWKSFDCPEHMLQGQTACPSSAARCSPNVLAPQTFLPRARYQ